MNVLDNIFLCKWNVLGILNTRPQMEFQVIDILILDMCSVTLLFSV